MKDFVLFCFLQTVTQSFALQNFLETLIGDVGCDILPMNMESWLLSSMNKPIITSMDAAKESACVVAIGKTEKDLKKLPELAKMEVIVVSINVTGDIRLSVNKRMGQVIVLTQRKEGDIHSKNVS